MAVGTDHLVGVDEIAIVPLWGGFVTHPIEPSMDYCHAGNCSQHFDHKPHVHPYQLSPTGLRPISAASSSRMTSANTFHAETSVTMIAANSTRLCEDFTGYTPLRLTLEPRSS